MSQETQPWRVHELYTNRLGLSITANMNVISAQTEHIKVLERTVIKKAGAELQAALSPMHPDTILPLTPVRYSTRWRLSQEELATR